MADVLAAGLLNGFVYALIAMGLALIWGIMDVINFAHGEFLMLGMYTAFWLYTLLGLDPVTTFPVAIALLAFVGFATYHLIVRRIMTGPPIVQILATFGLSLLLRQLAFLFFSPNYQSIPHTLVHGSLRIAGVQFGMPQAVTAGAALVAAAGLFFAIYRTRWGLALLTVAEDRETASLVGVNPERVNQQVWMVGSGAVGLAGALMTMFFYVFPGVGFNFALLAFVAVSMGGFGSIPGAFLGGVIIGVVQSLAGFYLDPSLQNAVVFGLFLVILWLRPQGLLGRW
jgi:branched-chain amino acid transport system permease protein